MHSRLPNRRGPTVRRRAVLCRSPPLPHPGTYRPALLLSLYGLPPPPPPSRRLHPPFCRPIAEQQPVLTTSAPPPPSPNSGPVRALLPHSARAARPLGKPGAPPNDHRHHQKASRKEQELPRSLQDLSATVNKTRDVGSCACNFGFRIRWAVWVGASCGNPPPPPFTTTLPTRTTPPYTATPRVSRSMPTK